MTSPARLLPRITPSRPGLLVLATTSLLHDSFLPWPRADPGPAPFPEAREPPWPPLKTSSPPSSRPQRNRPRPAPTPPSSIPGDLLGAEWAGCDIAPAEAKRLLMGPGRMRATGCGRTSPQRPEARRGVEPRGRRDGRADAQAHRRHRRRSSRGCAKTIWPPRCSPVSCRTWPSSTSNGPGCGADAVGDVASDGESGDDRRRGADAELDDRLDAPGSCRARTRTWCWPVPSTLG